MLLAKHTKNKYFDPNQTSEVIVDAGPEGLGAILSQPSRSTSKGIVAYASRALNETEKKFSQVEREMLAITWAIEHFRIYLFGAHFTVVTDHKPLLGILSTLKTTTPRLERLRLKLQGYDFTLIHRPGSSNPSDYFSRHPETSHTPHRRVSAEAYVNFVTNEALPFTLSRQVISEHTQRDNSLSLLKCVVQYKNLQPQEKELLRPYLNLLQEISMTSDGILLRGNRIIIPPSLQQKVISLAHRGHPGIVRTKQLLRERTWFPGMDSMVETKIRSCIACQAVTPVRKRDPIQSTPLPARPWSELSIDFQGPLPDSKYVLVVLDEHSRFPLAEIVNSTSAVSTLKVLRKWFSQFGVPDVLKSDNGPPFNSYDYKNFLHQWGIKSRHVTPYWPEANGTSERFFKTIKKVIQAAVIESKNWQEELDVFLMNYRVTPHATTGVSPASIIFKHPFNLGYLPLFASETPENDIASTDRFNKEKQATYANICRRTSYHNLSPEDSVLLKQQQTNKFVPAFDPSPYKVTSVKGNQITAERGDRRVVRNSSFFKKFIDEDIVRQEPSEQILPPQDDEQEIQSTSSPTLVPSPKSPAPFVSSRPTRNIKLPSRYKDFILNP